MIDASRKLDSRIVVYATEGFYSLPPTTLQTEVEKGLQYDQTERRARWLRFRNSTTDMDLVRERLGVEVLFENVEKMSEKAARISEWRANDLVGRWIEQATEVEGNPRKVLVPTAQWYIALREDLEEREAAGFTTICSQIAHRYDCNPCLAFMMLASEGYYFSCGIDLNGLLTELMLDACRPGPMFQGNLMVENLSRARLSIHHCMAPFTMDSGRELNLRHIHSNEKSKGYVSAVGFKKGTVTLARLDSSLDFIHASRGELVDYVNHRDRCVNEAIVEVSYPENFEKQRIKPIAPSRIVHYVMRYGDYVDSLCALAEALGLRCLSDGR